MKSTLAKSVVLAATLLFGPGQATQAEWVTIHIEGVVDYVIDEDNYLGGKVDVCDTITGWYTYDSQTTDSYPYPSGDEYIGAYWHYATPAGITLLINELTFNTNPTDIEFLISLQNAGGPYSTDDFLVRSYNNSPLDSETSIDEISWWLSDPTGSALSSDALPTGPPNLDQWQSNHLRIDSNRNFIIDGHITSAIPEPASLMLLALGTLGLFSRKIPRL